MSSQLGEGTEALAEARLQALQESLTDLGLEDTLPWVAHGQGQPSNDLLGHHRRAGATLVVTATTGNGFPNEVVFSKGDAISTAHEAAATGRRVALLNIADPTPPGRSYLAGAQTPEERLCHRSTLLIRLKVHCWHVEQSGNGDYTVSYTHLTLPTIYSV